MKLLITTRADASCLEWVKLTHPVFLEYSKKVNADFMVLDESVDCHEAVGGIGNGVYQYRIMKHYDLHDHYDRILHLDSDMLLTPECPDLFEMVPYDHIASIYEDVGSRRPQRHQCITNAQKQFGEIGWRDGYINTGVFVTSKCHRDIYRKIQNRYFVDWGTDDIHIGYLINKYGYKVKELPYQYNHMTMFSEEWNGSPSRFDSHIIHYAGRGVFDSGVSDKIEQAKKDFKRIYG
jgi:hypothetical protein